MTKEKYTYDYINSKIFELESVKSYRDLTDEEEAELKKFKKLLEYPIDNEECLKVINLMSQKLDKTLDKITEIIKPTTNVRIVVVPEKRIEEILSVSKPRPLDDIILDLDEIRREKALNISDGEKLEELGLELTGKQLVIPFGNELDMNEIPLV